MGINLSHTSVSNHLHKLGYISRLDDQFSQSWEHAFGGDLLQGTSHSFYSTAVPYDTFLSLVKKSQTLHYKFFYP